MQLTQELSDAQDTRSLSTQYTAGGSTGYASGTAIVPGVTAPLVPVPPSAPIVAPAPVPLFDPTLYAPAPLPGTTTLTGALPVLGTPSPCSTCKYAAPGGVPGAVPGATPTGGAYISPPGTGMVVDRFAPALPDHPPTPIAPADADGMTPPDWWKWIVLFGLVVVAIEVSKGKLRP